MSRARLPTRWRAGRSPISASRSQARSAVRSAARWCVARSAACCGDERPVLPHVMSQTSNGLRLPSLRAPLDVLLLVCCVVLTAFVLGPELVGNGKTKDGVRGYGAGQQVLHGKAFYPSDINDYFAFIYPPLPAVLLAIPSWFGKPFLFTCLSLLNCAAWWLTAQFSNAL